MKLVDEIAKAAPFYSLEFFPPKDQANWPAFFTMAEKLRLLNPCFVSVTYGAGGSTQAYTLEITGRLAALGFTPMAHLTCVGATQDAIRDYLSSLEREKVYNILALRGDVPAGKEILWEECEFTYASDLVRFVREEFPHFGIGIAAYLTPHPESPSFADDRKATVRKFAAGSDFAVTQLFFDPREYFEYVAQLQLLGVEKPVIPGVLPVQSMDSLRRVLRLSGCNIPAKLYLQLEEAERSGGPDAVKEAGIAYAVFQIRQLIDGGAPGIHLYTLNQADMCLRIAQAVGAL